MKKSMGADFSMCVQPAFIIGTRNEDGSPDFAPITWLSVTCNDECSMLVISMYGTKRTKQNALREKRLSANLVSTDMLPLVDYLGSRSGHKDKKLAMEYGVGAGAVVDVPVLEASRWIYECEVVKTVNTGATDTLFCLIKNVLVDESVDMTEEQIRKHIDLTKLDPVVYSGDYHSVGEHLGQIGDFLPERFR